MSVMALSSLSFFTVTRYVYDRETVCDFRNFPRPHFCMGLVLEGEGVFFPEDGGEIHVLPGEVIFVPVATRYLAVWKGTPRVRYTSMHFSFETQAYAGGEEMRIQKVALEDFAGRARDFEAAAEGVLGEREGRLRALGSLYSVLAELDPKLERGQERRIDQRMERALEYLNMNSEKEISVSALAELCNMSESHFYACFKAAVGLSPVQYKNKVCVNRAMLLLIRDRDRSIEEISEVLGFYSAAYFRRVFRRLTGKTPTEYRKGAVEG